MRLTQHTEFSGNASELADLAVACSRDLRLALGTDKTNERLVRYYVTEGVLDRPERVGRDAAYGYRHLLQLLTARRMADAGITLAAVAHHNRAATTKSLEEGLARPLPTAAEILVQEFMGSTRKKGDEGSAGPHLAPGHSLAAPHPAPDPHKPRPAMALPDLLAAVEHMKTEVMSQVKELEKQAMAMTHELHARQSQADHERHETRALLREGIEHLHQALRHEMRALVHESLEHLHKPLHHEILALRHENAELAQRVGQLIERMEALNPPPPPAGHQL